MKRYDLAFSLGAACSCSQSLREAGLQFASYPFDWVCSPGILASVAALESEFADWFRKEDLKLIDVRREPLSCKCYRNVRTGFLFVHDFPVADRFEEVYPDVVKKFRRRADRLTANIGAARTVLAVYVEMPFREAEPDDHYRDVQRRFRERFPSCETDVLVFRNRPGVSQPTCRDICPGVRMVEMDIVIRDGGVISHQVNRNRLVKWLCANVALRNLQSAGDRLAFKAQVKIRREAKWNSRSPVIRLMRQISYKLYRRLERYLIGQGLVPRELPFRF